MAQQIYGRGLSFKDAGLTAAAPWKFEKNYRNTRSIAALGLQISKMPYYADEPDMVAPEFPTADGPKPALVQLGSLAAEREFVTKIAMDRSRFRSVAILCRTHSLLNELKAYLPSTAIPLRDDSGNWAADSGFFFGTYHAAKGLEFDVVFLPFLNDGLMPAEQDIEQDGEDEASAKDGRLLYVGVTRAKSELVLTYSGRVSKLLPTCPNLYEIRNA